MGLTNFSQEKQQVEDSRRREKKLSASLVLKTKEALIQCPSLKKYVCIIRPILNVVIREAFLLHEPVNYKWIKSLKIKF